MPGQMFDHIRELYQAELYEDLKQLFCIVISMLDGNAGGDLGEILSLPQKYQSLVYYGEALYQLGEYKKSESVFMRCLQLRKTLNKSKIKTVSSTELTSEVDLKYKIYQCLHKMKQNVEALNILESISTKKRTARVNLALAKLYLHEGRDRSAITCYKELIREHPLALDALTSLLTLGMRGVDLSSYVINSIPQSSCDWLNSWIKGQARMASKEYSSAITTFRSMEPKHGLKDNVLILSYLGEACFHGGHYTQAMAQFRRVHIIDPLYLKNMDMYAYLLFKEKKTEDLHLLAQGLMSVSEHAVEPWVAMGYSSLALHSSNANKNKTIRAIYCAQKAYSIDNLSVQALVLKGTALLDMKKGPQAMQHFQEAVRMAPNRFEAYQGLIDCYVSNRKIKEALAWAMRACKTIGNNARTFTLVAHVLAKDPATVAKAKQYLNRAMTFDGNLLDPVYLMVDLLIQEQDFAKGVELLRKMLENHSTTRLHQQLADCLASMDQRQEALDQYSISLSLDPNNFRAREASERVEKHNEMGLDGTFDVEPEEMMNPSDGEPDYSDMESTWSETEFSQP
ncbi:anaphase-promoting complex subunit 7-like [Physella acuta]|uniref:anaphase-promoting complex subunit 7-like n=1 Tax=Physella acuta TaxID=109671 RepID=UPI0027DE80FC|nr:anaphase-promoting complex subunit 7-like [Physella acuta]